MATERILFELNFGRHLWKGDLVVQMETPQVEEFLIGIQKSWEQVTKVIEEAQKMIKKQFDKKRQNPQELKVRDNMWLESKNIHMNQSSKKLDNKRYEPFKISKDIGSGTFQLELLEGWAIYNVFNEDLLTQCMKLKFKGQYKELAPLPTIINKEEKYKVKEVRKHRKCGKRIQYLVHWKGYGYEHDQWIAETRLSHAREVMKDYWTRCSSQNL